MAGNKWNRWFLASVASHLHTAATAANLPLVVEQLDDRSQSWRESRIRAEVTISGPSTKELSKGYFLAELDVQVIISTHRQSDDNAYDHHDKVGLMMEALDTCIIVKEYDVDVPNPDEVCTITPRGNAADRVKATNIRAADSDQVSHTIIEISYTGYLHGE